MIDAKFPAKTKFLFKPCRYKVLYGGRGCIHGDTLLETPNGKIKVSDFKGGDIFAFDGKRIVKTYAGKPVIYNPEMLYSVVFSDGSQIKTTAKHKFLTVNGWAECSSLHVGDLIPLPPNELPPSLQQRYCDVYPSMLLEDVRHCLQILAGFLWCYFEGYHQYDEQPHWDAKTVLDVSQQLIYAQQHTHHASMHEGVQGCEYKNSLLQPSSHLANLAYLLSKVVQSFEVQENCSDDIISELISVTYQLLLLSHERNNLESQAQGLALAMVRLDSLSCLPESLQKVFDIVRIDFGDSSYSSHVVCKHNLSITKTIVEIKPFKVCEFYDLFVPFFNNYIAEGVVNHNSGKSWAMARALLIVGTQKTLRVLCVREVQNSIAESVHKLLSQQIEALGLQQFYEIQNTTIFSKINKSEFIFEGIKHNVTKIKSMEGIDVCWAEEAESISSNSWDVLIPTIRKDGSEIWISFNPRFEDDETYQRFVSQPPKNSAVVKMNWTDNKYISQELLGEKDDLKLRDMDKYLWVWEGHCLKILDGAVYKDEMRKMREDGRITNVPYEPSKPVYTFWDLGFGDSTAIWFVQMVAGQYRVIDYLENNRQAIDYYVRQIQAKNYVYERHYLPHDGNNANLATGKTMREIVEGYGLKVEITPQIGIDNGINAVRMAMSNVWIDENKCKDGIKALEYYHYEQDKNGNRKNTPAHDWSSHGCDAFRYMAVAFKESVAPKPYKPKHIGSHGWMG